MREVLNAIFYVLRSGCQWDMLPHDLPPKSTVYDDFAQWRDDGTCHENPGHAASCWGSSVTLCPSFSSRLTS
jgi:hypothetical protein